MEFNDGLLGLRRKYAKSYVCILGKKISHNWIERIGKVTSNLAMTSKISR